MKAHSKIHFENENMFLENWKVVNTFKKKNAIGKKYKKGSVLPEIWVKECSGDRGAHMAKHQYSEVGLPVNSSFVVFIYWTV